MNVVIPVLILVIEIMSPAGVFNNPVNYATQAGNAFITPLNSVTVGTSSEDFVKTYDVSGPITYEEIKYQAINNCKNNKSPDAKLIDLLIEVEKTYNVPPSMRGMILSAACMESGYNPLAKGDRKFSRSKKKPMAIGLLQQWAIYEKMYPGMDRTNPKDAATTWMKHIVKMIPRVKRDCKYRTETRIWLAAWVTGIRSKKVGGRCKERPLHYRLLKRWHRNIKKCRKAAYETCRPGC